MTSRKILLDERGAEWASRQLAEKLARWRDDGVAVRLTFWIGGADGASQGLKDQRRRKARFRPTNMAASASCAS
jgi:23S rRNA pseudoU1915 N3-methylase RlmH